VTLMHVRKLLLLLGFTEDDTKMASVRWKRFKKHLSQDRFSLEWMPIKLPYCEESSSLWSKGVRELTVLRHARRLAAQLATDMDPNAKTTILASIPTLDPLYVGAMLRRLGTPDTELVLEVRDVYARPEMCEYNSLRRRLEIFKEAMLIRHVDRFLFLTDEIKRRYCTYYPHLPAMRAGKVITNGYDPQEYGPVPRTDGRPELLHIGYFGSFYTSRNPDLLFQALSMLRQNDAPSFGLLRMHIWGEPGDYPLEAKIVEHGLKGTVVYHGIAPHDHVIREYTTAGVNLIITHRTGSSYALPGKLFEYIGAGRPVWAITEDQILRDFISRYGLGYLSSHDAPGIAQTLGTILHAHADSGRLPDVNPPGQFEISALTRELERFLVNGTTRVT
jgi:glycosyltransferase involved in cell wall biosynthesis